MNPSEIECAEKRMQQKWYELVSAEQQGATPQALERLYSAYILCVEEYNRRSAEHQEQPLPMFSSYRQDTSSEAIFRSRPHQKKVS